MGAQRETQWSVNLLSFQSLGFYGCECVPVIVFSPSSFWKLQAASRRVCEALVQPCVWVPGRGVVTVTMGSRVAGPEGSACLKLEMGQGTGTRGAAVLERRCSVPALCHCSPVHWLSVLLCVERVQAACWPR